MAQPYHAPPPITVVTPTVDAGGDEPTPDQAEPVVPSSQFAISETLEELAPRGCPADPRAALHSEVDAYLGRRRYDRVDDDFSCYRKGYAR